MIEPGATSSVASSIWARTAGGSRNSSSLPEATDRRLWAQPQLVQSGPDRGQIETTPCCGGGIGSSPALSNGETRARTTLGR
jgi:hypothetical protein